MRFLKALKELILNTLFPPVCISCKKEGDFLCVDCLKNLDKKKIRSNGRKIDDPDIHYLDGVIYALDYAKNPQIQAAVKQFKYRFTEELAEYFADLMIEKIGELNMAKKRKIILIPVPLHKKRLNYRGFNQAEVIAKVIQDRMGNEAEVIPMLKRVRHTDQQAKLNKSERHKNLKGAFILNKKCIHEQKMYTKNTIYFIIDDVFTTGATLESCAEVLKGSGFEKAYGLVIARAFR